MSNHKHLRLLRGDLSLIFYISLGCLLLHFGANFFGGYGFFRDELYYLACADHLSAGYVDQPPLSIYILKLSTLMFGDTLFALRIFPAIAGACTVFLTGLITKDLGGRVYAPLLACLCMFSPGLLAMDGFYSMNCFDILFWTATCYITLSIIKTGDKKLWIWLGLVLGFGLLNKIGVLFLGAGLFVGIILTPQRQWLKSAWPYVTACLSFVLFLPYIVWNFNHDFAHLEFIRNAAGKYSSQNQVRFLIEQVLINNPIAILVWLPGLIAIFFNQALRPYRLLGYLYLIPLVIFLLNGTSKAEYLLPAYSILWASGSFLIEKVTDGKRYGMLPRIALPVLIISLGILLLPVVLPVLPVESFIRYSKAIGLSPSTSENKELAELPQFYADMFGWEDKASAVADVFKSLPQADQKICAIYSSNYGRCGAIDFFGSKLGLPKSIGSHNSYWIWGPRQATGEVMIVLGGDAEDLDSRFEDVREIRRVSTKYCMPYENDLSIFVCRKLKMPMKDLWPLTKHFE